MTDSELIQLLQDKSPEELSLDEIRLLKERLAESDELRTALFEQLEMEQYLSEALGRIEISPDKIAARSRAHGPISGNPILLAVCVLLCLGLAGFIAAVMIIALRQPNDTEVAVVDSVDNTPDDKPPTDEPEENPAAPADKTPLAETPDIEAPPATTDPPVEEPPDVDPPQEEPPPPQGPWVTGLAEAPRPFAENWFVDFDISKRVPTKDDMSEWFAASPGKSLRCYEEHFENIRYGAIQGVARFRSPWPADAMLRFSLLKSEKLRIHLFAGEQGVTLFRDARHDYYDRWAAYVTTRDKDQPTPKTFVLTSTDFGRDEFSESRYGPALLLRWQDGEIVLTRGDIEMARAAMPQPPQELVWEGLAAFRGLEMFRYADAPPAHPQGEVTQTFAKPADLPWAGVVPELAKLEKRADGAVTLSLNNGEQPAWAAAPLPTDRVRFVEAQLTDIRPGTMVHIGQAEVRDAEGKVTQLGGRPQASALTFIEEEKTKRLAAVWDWRKEDLRTASLPAIDDRSVPLVGSTCWVRFLTTVDCIRCWISPDGENWALLVHRSPTAGPITHLGIGCTKQTPDAAITVRQIRLRELPAINRLATPELLAQALPLGDAADYSQWLVAVCRAQPADVEIDAWRRACAVRTLAIGCVPRVGQALLDLLLRDAAQRAQPIDEELRLLGDAALLASIKENLPGDRPFNLPERYFDLGRRAAVAGEPRPFTKIRAALMRDGAAQREYFKAYDAHLIRTELIELAYGQRWGELAAFVRQLKFYAGRDALPQVAPLATWAEALAARQLPGSVGDGAAMLDKNWQHPLVEQYSKEAYNVMAEFQAALDSESYQDAASMIAGLDPYGTGGLLPSSRDGSLLVSLPTAVAAAMADSRELRGVMNEKFAPLGRLRVNQAMSSGDEAAVELATTQFHGTKAAGDAHGWLGDRALSSGEFAQAIAHYRQALQHASILEKPQLLARMRLTAAMAGQDLGEPVKVAVRLGDTSLAAADFENLVLEMRTAHAGDSSLLATASVAGDATSQSPQPSGFQVQLRARLDGDTGENPGNIHGHTRQYDVPWLERQLGIAVHENIAYVTNRFHVAAYDLANNGNRLWQSPRAPGNPGQTHDWMLTSMQPVPYGDKVFARQLLREGPALVCINRQNGQHVWTSQQRETLVLSDPVIAQGKLFALTLHDITGSDDLLKLSTFALDSGELLESRELVTLRNSWQGRRVCAVTQWEDSLVASLGGLVLCVDLTGNLRWARKQIMLPAQQDQTWVAQRFDRPLVFDRRVVVAAPGVRSVECINLDSGALVWQYVLPHINRLISADAERVVVYAGEELIAFNSQSGEIAWQRKWLAPMDAELSGSTNGLLLAHKVPSPKGGNQFCPELVWFDVKSGEPKSQTVLPDLSAEDPRFGPWVAHRDRIWTFFARNINEPHRDLVELTPQGEATPAVATIATNNAAPWLAGVATAEVRDAVARALPQWRLLSTVADSSVFLIDAHGEKDMARLTSKAEAPTVIGRYLEIAKGSPKLVMRIGSEPSHHWRLIVRHDHQVVHEQVEEWEKNPNVWKDITVDLSPVAGKKGWLTVEAQFIQRADRSWTYWKRLDVTQ